MPSGHPHGAGRAALQPLPPPTALAAPVDAPVVHVVGGLADAVACAAARAHGLALIALGVEVPHAAGA